MQVTRGTFDVAALAQQPTPYYYYDLGLLQQTLSAIRAQADHYHYHVHYAMKANANARLLGMIRQYGFGADCVSGGEIQAALQAGFPAEKIVYAGVGKSDKEIILALNAGIACFNVESIAELEVIHELAAAHHKIAPVALRINPEVKADTHHYIATGLKENKFGIALSLLDAVLDQIASLTHISLEGLHFHIGSQITDMDNFKALCVRINEIQERLSHRRIIVKSINVGGGFGVNYEAPDKEPMPNFAAYFAVFHNHLKLHSSQTLHFELGRSVVCQCGSLITRVLYVKEGINKRFAIVDAGMTELIRPALYQAYHKIENLTSEEPVAAYDVVGPICESSDSFGKDVPLHGVRRGDLMAIRSAGAYGEVMASQYNCRELPKSFFK